jgi:16S rRNA (cytosine1402-N4)-methyltransferase
MFRAPHIPVLVDAVVAALSPRSGGVYVDGTFGAGGYARALLDAAPCTVWGIDRDPDAIEAGERLTRRYGDRLHLIHGRFGDMGCLLAERHVHTVDGIALDLGVSSMQLDMPERGFSFRADGPLDMRMERDGDSAETIVNDAQESDLADILFKFGEERSARRVARAIVRARSRRRLTRTSELAEVVRDAVPGGRSPHGTDAATRTFQALRIKVNDELGELERGLCAAERILAPRGRLAVVSFHSLEDRTVKEFLRTRSGEAPGVSRHLPPVEATRKPSFTNVSKRPVLPAKNETANNPRARSARLRSAERTDAPAWPESAGLPEGAA